MGRFISHEGIAQGLFNSDYNGATSSSGFAVWQDFLGNTDEVVLLLCDRLASDYAALVPKMRKHYQANQIETSLRFEPGSKSF